MRHKPTAALIIFLALSACANPASQSTSTGNGLRVLAAESFLADIAQHVAGNRIRVEALVAPGIDPHEFQMTPQEAIKIERSQVLIVNGLGYETWLDKILQDSTTSRVVVTASDGLSPIPDPTGVHVTGDPHLWMNPLNVVQYVANIREGLSRADPAGGDIYAANAEAYTAELRDLDQWIQNEVAGIPKERRYLVTNHGALQYFANAYGLQIIGTVIPGVSSEAATSAKEMASLIKTIQASKVPAIFVDVSENQDLARQIAAESGANVVTDLYVETLSAATGPAATYIDMLKHDVQLIVAALR